MDMNHYWIGQHWDITVSLLLQPQVPQNLLIVTCFWEKTCYSTYKNTRCATIELRENVHVLKRGRFLHEYTATQPKYITRVNTTNLFTKSITV